MAAAQPRRRRKLMGEINVVPYIDVMLVLLIIFMITAPLLAEGIKVELPKAGARPIPPEMLKDSKPIVLTIDERGRLYLNYGAKQDEPLDPAAVEAGAAAVLRRAPETTVLVRGDYRVAYGEVVAAMTLLQRAGASKVGFITQPPEQKRNR
jgi:biopolymer transport protein TolR